MRVLHVWDHIDDVEPDNIERADSYSPFTRGDMVRVEGRKRQRFVFHEHVVNHTRGDEYVRVIGMSKSNFRRSYTFAPSQLVAD